jgi:hypothetical protein
MSKMDPFIEEMVTEAGLPDTTKFMGYVVRLPESDEFLHSVKYAGDMAARKWALRPEMAKVYKRKDKAHQEIKRYGPKAGIGYLFDIGDKYFVISEE